jgi:GrpB-like predicted nucleotidyltransferase (UPF0157 family)
MSKTIVEIERSLAGIATRSLDLRYSFPCSFKSHSHLSKQFRQPTGMTPKTYLFNETMKVEVVPPDPAWQEEFQQESQQLAWVMGENIVAIHHIGSTAIPSIYAKPVIDFLIEVKSIAKTDEQNGAMTTIGYEALGEFGLPGRRYFRKNRSPEIRTHNVHTYEVGSPEITRHLAFRDYMIAHPDDAQQYSELKRQLAKQYPHDIEGYMDGKDEFVKMMEKKALIWQLSVS